MKNHVAKGLGVGLAALLTSAVGCSKREVETSAPPSGTSTASDPAQAQPAPIETPAVRASAADMAAQQAALERLRQAEQAARQREYERAVEAMLAIREQQRILTEQQAQLYYQQMQKLQSDLAAAIAAGDPRAKAAAERLRRAATVR
ncbi:MAG: hypothetical protein RMN51_06880 [Verrucomicrobiota bacterium]|nr:hypothetical protein [Limisphaera sp.]MDW8381816.1 hypothetical protein [Verrucomicrobiota bacterium]